MHARLGAFSSSSGSGSVKAVGAPGFGYCVTQTDRTGGAVEGAEEATLGAGGSLNVGVGARSFAALHAPQARRSHPA